MKDLMEKIDSRLDELNEISCANEIYEGRPSCGLGGCGGDCSGSCLDTCSGSCYEHCMSSCNGGCSSSNTYL